MTDETKLDLIDERLGILEEIEKNLDRLSTKRSLLFHKARQEVEGEGLTPETCLAMSTVMLQSERDSLKLRDGLKSVHQTMEHFVTVDANEGPKDWP